MKYKKIISYTRASSNSLTLVWHWELGIIDIWGWIIPFHWYAGHSPCSRMICCISDLYFLDTRSTAYPLMIKLSPDIVKCSLGENCPWLRITALVYQVSPTYQSPIPQENTSINSLSELLEFLHVSSFFCVLLFSVKVHCYSCFCHLKTSR